MRGRLYWATDTSLLYYDDGAAWQTVGPYTAPASMFKAWRNAALDVGPSASTFVPVDWVGFDSAGGMSGGMYRFPVAGYYQVSGRISAVMNPAASAFVAELWVSALHPGSRGGGGSY
jgi:hypothetical protein